jgi:hypothetical protein
MNDGTKLCDFWDRRKGYRVITKRMMGQTRGIYGTGEVDIESQQDKLWDKMR